MIPKVRSPGHNEISERVKSPQFKLDIKMNHIIDTIQQIERIIKVELEPNIWLRDEKACLIRMKAHIFELKYLVTNSIADEILR